MNVGIHDICIRFGRVGEQSQLEGLQRRASLVWDDYRDALLAHPDAIHLPREQLRKRQVRVAEVAAICAGFSAVCPLDPGLCELDGLFVEPAHWHCGIGRALVYDAMRLARRRGSREMLVTANPRAAAFYARLGFVACGIESTRFGNAPRLRVCLNAPSVPKSRAR